MTDRLTYRTVLDHIRDTARSGGYTRRLDLALWTVARARESLAPMLRDDLVALTLACSAIDLATTEPMSTSDHFNAECALRIVARWRRRLCEVRERDAAEIARLAEHWDGYSDVPSVGTEIRVPSDRRWRAYVDASTMDGTPDAILADVAGRIRSRPTRIVRDRDPLGIPVLLVARR